MSRSKHDHALVAWQRGRGSRRSAIRRNRRAVPRTPACCRSRGFLGRALNRHSDAAPAWRVDDLVLTARFFLALSPQKLGVYNFRAHGSWVSAFLLCSPRGSLRHRARNGWVSAFPGCLQFLFPTASSPRKLGVCLSGSWVSAFPLFSSLATGPCLCLVAARFRCVISQTGRRRLPS